MFFGRGADLIEEWMNEWLIDWLISCLIGWSIGWSIDWLADRLIDWLFDWLIGWSIGCLVACASTFSIPNRYIGMSVDRFISLCHHYLGAKMIWRCLPPMIYGYYPLNIHMLSSWSNKWVIREFAKRGSQKAYFFCLRRPLPRDLLTSSWGSLSSASRSSARFARINTWTIYFLCAINKFGWVYRGTQPSPFFLFLVIRLHILGVDLQNFTEIGI